MQKPNVDLVVLRDAATAIAREAGALTLRYYQTGLAAELKSDQSPVTQADRESELLMRRRIAENFPDHSIIGEEFGTSMGTSTFRWILDPIDGTLSFIHGVPQYGVIVGIEYAGEMVVGVVYLPVLNEIVAAAHGHGCLWNGQPCHVSTTVRIEEALLLATDDIRLRRTLPGYATFADRVRMVRTWGDCFGPVMVATGRADIWLDGDLDVTDIGALLPIIEEAGGTLSNWRGERSAWTDTVLVSNSVLHHEALALLQANDSP